jgi:uncharacterized membrane protein YoaK (UPF0700 family)
MFTHQGKNRTIKHNLRLATILSFVAGIVNVTGVLSVKTLTTNVTGHFAYFAEEITNKNYQLAAVFLIYTLFFLAGAFTSNFLTEYVSLKKHELSHLPAITIEFLMLIALGLYSMHPNYNQHNSNWIAFGLLFAMGIQNALVTKISHSTVRTTHLTGLFTDLGIELSQLFFYKKIEERKILKRSIILRLSIILFFFLGCSIGGLFYSIIALKTLFVAAIFILIALYYDNILFLLISIKRKNVNLKKQNY